MTTRLTLVGAVAAAATLSSVPARALAQDARHQTADTMIISDDGPSDRLLELMMNRHARLGIQVNAQARATDSIGAYVSAVTPGGPAARAGLKSGDIITKLDGKSVLSDASTEGRPGQSLSGLRLIELAARLEPNDTVPIEFVRGKERKTISVVTESERDLVTDGGPGARRFIFRGRPGPGPGERLGPMPGDFDRGDFHPFMAGGPLADLELAPLNSDLGTYFGATDGVLVISAPKDGKLGLKGGDVILAVGDRKPTSPLQLMRILRSYDQNESFKIDILRNRKRETVTANLGG